MSGLPLSGDRLTRVSTRGSGHGPAAAIPVITRGQGDGHAAAHQVLGSWDAFPVAPIGSQASFKAGTAQDLTVPGMDLPTVPRLPQGVSSAAVMVVRG